MEREGTSPFYGSGLPAGRESLRENARGGGRGDMVDRSSNTVGRQDVGLERKPYFAVSGAGLVRSQRPVRTPLSPVSESSQAIKPIATRIAAVPKAPPREETSGFSDGAIFYGALTSVAGFLIVLTIVFAQIGAVVAILGAATVIVGLAGKLASSLWRKLNRHARV